MGWTLDEKSVKANHKFNMPSKDVVLVATWKKQDDVVTPPTDEVKPPVDKVNAPKKDVDSKAPETGVQSMTVNYVLVTAAASLLLLALIKRSKINNA